MRLGAALLRVFVVTSSVSAVVGWIAGQPALSVGKRSLLLLAGGTAVPRERRALRGGMSASQMKDSNGVQFFTNKMCPFAQKAWITLEEKQVPFELVEIGLYGAGGKPDWFMKMNPKGLVPVLKHGDTVVTESNDIIKYVDKHFGAEGSLRGGDPDVDEWMALLSKVQMEGKALMCGGESSKLLAATLANFEAQIAGPFLMGEAFSLADAAAAPMFQRMMSETARFGLQAGTHPRIFAWWSAVSDRPSFSKTVVSSYWWWW